MTPKFNVDAKSLYGLKLHESMSFKIIIDGSTNTDTISVLRVPGGWLYSSHGFVPFNNEFMEVDK
jgi:hypothetical protein